MLRAILVLSLILSLAACGSRLNPLNWFGGEREQRVRIAPDAAAENPNGDPRPLVSEIAQLSVEQTTSGAIIRVTGLTASQGYFDAALVEVERGDGNLVLALRAAPPLGAATPGVQQIAVGLAVTSGELAGIRTITVIGQNNRRTVSR
ncbi:hypothetical protein V8J82_18095 [Gymnodinialimonas sp. 2305UL16-5]|uniref:hypothetical protein n=1 Tax=Gymnodinialimonas mytili TaxID=3126503 RepID=UPI0030A5C72A